MWFFFFQAEDGIRDIGVTGVQTCALPISRNGRDEWTHCRLAGLVCVRALLGADGLKPPPDSVAAPFQGSHLLLLAGNLDGFSGLRYSWCHRRQPPAPKPYRVAILRDRFHLRGGPLLCRVR